MVTDSSKRIFLASDHAGFDLKSYIISYLSNRLNIEIIDLGCENAVDSVDYPVFSDILCKEIENSNDNDFGILICGSGIGMSIAANRNRFIRAALCFNKDLAKLARNHNNANVLCLGARFVSKDIAIEIVETFLESNFDGGRHQNRVQKMS